jgi:hypothetical protein
MLSHPKPATAEALLQALTDRDFAQAAQLIEMNPAILKAREFNDKTIFDVFTFTKHSDIINWLCIKFQSLGFSIDFYDDQGLTPITRAFLFGIAESVNVLLKYTAEPNLKEWLVLRQIICIFGTNFLHENNFSVKSTHARSAESGLTIESTQIMSSAICKFAEDDSRYAGIGKSILNFNSTTRSDSVVEIIKRANHNDNPRVLFDSGYHKHSFIASIKKNSDGSYELRIYDDNEIPILKNYFNLYLLGKSLFVKQINIPAEKRI